MRDGQLAQVGAPQELYRSPSSAFVAEFIGPTNLIEGEIIGSSDGLTHVSTAVGEIRAATRAAEGARALATRRVVVSIRPELIRIVRDGNAGDDNRLVGAVVEDTFLGQSSEHVVAVGNGQLRVVSAPPRLGLGGNVTLEFNPADVVVLTR
jgi:spermidine/putrescine transport system ATP-binding protein